MMGSPACARWRRTWCVRPVTGRASTSAAPTTRTSRGSSAFEPFEPSSSPKLRADIDASVGAPADVDSAWYRVVAGLPSPRRSAGSTARTQFLAFAASEPRVPATDPIAASTTRTSPGEVFLFDSLALVTSSVRFSTSSTTAHRARYVFFTSRFSNCACRSLAALLCFASSNTPLVSRSSLCTATGSAAPSFGASRAENPRRPSKRPPYATWFTAMLTTEFPRSLCAGYVITPAGFCTANTSSSSKTTRRGRGSGCRGTSRISCRMTRVTLRRSASSANATPSAVCAA